MSPPTAPASAAVLLGRLVPGLLPLSAVLSALVDAEAAVLERPAGSALPDADGGCPGMLVLERGSLAIGAVHESGRTITLRRVCAGEACGHVLRCAPGSGGWSVACVAERDVRGVLLSQGLCERLLRESPPFRRFAFAELAARLRAAERLACAAAFEPLDHRVAAALLARAGRAGTGELALTHQELADELGCTREAASRVLERLERTGAIALGRGRVAVRDRRALQGLGGRVVGANDSLRQRAVSSPSPDRLASTLTR